MKSKRKTKPGTVRNILKSLSRFWHFLLLADIALNINTVAYLSKVRVIFMIS